MNEIKIGNTILRLIQDTDARSPREWDNLGKIAYKHSRYNLGEEEISDPIDWLTEKLGHLDHEGDYTDEVRKELEEEFFEEFVALPLYLYDHSGMTMATTPFSCKWDSGQCGYIYCTMKDLENVGWNKEWMEETYPGKSLKEVGLHYLQGEVDVLDQYLTGEVYGFELVKVDEEGEAEIIDSCWGFYGDDILTNGVLDHLDSQLATQIEIALKQ